MSSLVRGVLVLSSASGILNHPAGPRQLLQTLLACLVLGVLLTSGSAEARAGSNLPLGLDLYRPVPEDNPQSVEKVRPGPAAVRREATLTGRFTRLRRLPPTQARLHGRASQGGRSLWPAGTPERTDAGQSCLGKILLLGWASSNAREASSPADSCRERDGSYARRSRRPAAKKAPLPEGVSKSFRARTELR